MVERLEVELARLADRSDDLIVVFIRPDRRALVGNAREPQHQCLELKLLLGEIGLDCCRIGAGLLGALAEFGLLIGPGVLEPRADRVAFGAQALDLGLEPAHLCVECEQGVEVEVHALVADRALDRLAVGLDEIQCQHRPCC